MKKNNKTIEQELREVRFRDLSLQESESTWNGIHARITGERSFSSVFSLKTNRKRMIPLLIGALLFASAGGTVAASNSAVPGDALFGIDRAVENVRLALADKESKAELKVRFSEERLDEVRNLVKRVKAQSNATSTATTTATTTATSTATTTPRGVNTDVALGVNVAIAFLNDAAADVSASGDAEAAAQIKAIVSQLENLANDADVKVRLKQNGDFQLKLKSGVATSTASTTGSVKLNTSGNKSRIEVREDGERIRIEIKDSGDIKVKSKIEAEIEAEDEDEEDDDDEDESENKGRGKGSATSSLKLDLRLR